MDWEPGMCFNSDSHPRNLNRNSGINKPEEERERATMADSTITIIGNLAADPEIRYTTNGSAVVKFRIGCSRRFQKNGEWTSKTSWWGVEAWGQLAENIAASFTKGMRVIVVGEVDADEYTTESGDKRVSYYVRASSVGPDLRWATSSVERNPRSDEGGKPKNSAAANDGYGDNSPYSVGGDDTEPF
jgi:single-strand DNA-binding protein